MKGSKGHQKSRKQRKQTGFRELAHICVLCSAIASPSLLSSSPIRVNPREGQRDKAGKARGGVRTPPPPNVHTPHCRAPGHSRAPTGPAMEPNGPARERVCPRACATARPGKERAPHTGQAGHTRSTARQHAPRHNNTTPPRQTYTPDEERAAKNKSKPRSPHSATAAVRMDVCAPGSEPSPCRLRTNRRPDGRVCARQ